MKIPQSQAGSHLFFRNEGTFLSLEAAACKIEDCCFVVKLVLDLRRMEFVTQMDIVLSPDNFLLSYFCSVPLVLWGQTRAVQV